MSGFGVILRREGSSTPQAIRQMEADLRYRGPDGVRSVVLDECVLVHAKLATTDEDLREEQPLRHVSHDWWLVADARLDNRQELRRALHGRVRHPLDTDADFVMAAFEFWGDGFAEHLVGNFAGAIWCRDRRELLVFRDQLGFRPVHWSAEDSVFVAASTLRAVHTQSTSDRELDVSHVVQFITDRRTTVTDTLWLGINRLAPAGQMTVAANLAMSVRTYWDPSPRVDKISVGDAAEGVRFLFEQAVRDQTRAIGPVGVQVSGGYDSSTVLSVARRISPAREFLALSLAFEEPESDERRYAAAAAAHAGLSPIVVDSTTVPFVPLSGDMSTSGSLFRSFDSHWYDQLASELTTRGGRVMLTGHGGDTLLHGGTVAHLDLICRLRLLKALRQVPSPTGTRRRVSQLMHGARSAASLSVQRSSLADPLRLSTFKAHLAVRRQSYSQPNTDVLTPAAALLVPELTMMSTAGGAWGYSSTQRLQSYRQPFDAFVAEAWDHLAAASLTDQRNPFYDLRLVEFGLGLTPAIIRPGGEYRGLHRRAFADDLPALIAGRTTKADFTRPVAASAARSRTPTERAQSLHLIRQIVNPRSVEAGVGFAERFCARQADEPANLWQVMACLRVASWATVSVGTK